MAKSQTPEVSIPPMEFKTVFDAATPEEAYAAIEDKRGEGALIMVPFDAIHPIKDFNIRVHTPDYEAHINRIAQSIRDNGFFRHAPLKVYPAKEGEQNLLYLVGGYTRYEAAKRAVASGAKLTRLPVVATPKGATLDDLLIGLDRDNDGRPLSAFEKGILVKRMIANGNDEDEIATALGITKQYVGGLLQLMAAPKQLHNMVINGEVAANLAIDLIKEHGSAKKALDALKEAGATGERRPNGADTSGGEGEGGGGTPRVTRSTVARTGGTAKAGKRFYEAMIEYLIVLNSQNGPQTAMDFLLKWHEKDPETMKEMAKLAAPGKKSKKKKAKPDKDTKIRITKGMSEEEKEKARKHNKRIKVRAEKAAKAAAAAAKAAKAGGTPAPEAEADPV